MARLDSKLDPKFATLALALLSPKYADSFSPDMLDLFHHQRKIAAFRESCLGADHKILLREIEYFDILAMHIQCRLLMFPFEHYEPATAIQTISRIALLIYIIQNRFGIYRRAPVSNVLAVQLYEALIFSDIDDLWNEYPDIMLWSLFFGAYASTGQSDYYPWFVSELAKGASLQGLSNWDNSEKILSWFFYIKRLHQAPFQKIWQEVATEMSTNARRVPFNIASKATPSTNTSIITSPSASVGRATSLSTGASPDITADFESLIDLDAE